MPQPPEPSNPQENNISVYELTEFYCQKRFEENCLEAVPSGKIISITDQGSEMKNYAQAFEDASDGAPICPIHQLQMVPQLINMTPPDNGENLV